MKKHEPVMCFRSETIEMCLPYREDREPLLFEFSVPPEELFPVRLEALVRSLAALLCSQYPCVVRGTVKPTFETIRIEAAWSGPVQQVPNATIIPKWRALVRNEIDLIESRLQKGAPAASTPQAGASARA